MAVAFRKAWPLGNEATVSIFLLPAASGDGNCVLHLRSELACAEQWFQEEESQGHRDDLSS